VVEVEPIAVEHPSSLDNQDPSTSITTTASSFSNGSTSLTSSPSLALVSSFSLIFYLLELIGSVLFYYNHPSQKLTSSAIKMFAGFTTSYKKKVKKSKKQKQKKLNEIEVFHTL
jgi:hypothetical protein